MDAVYLGQASPLVEHVDTLSHADKAPLGKRTAAMGPLSHSLPSVAIWRNHCRVFAAIDNAGRDTEGRHEMSRDNANAKKGKRDE